MKGKVDAMMSIMKILISSINDWLSFVVLLAKELVLLSSIGLKNASMN